MYCISQSWIAHQKTTSNKIAVLIIVMFYLSLARAWSHWPKLAGSIEHLNTIEKVVNVILCALNFHEVKLKCRFEREVCVLVCVRARLYMRNIRCIQPASQPAISFHSVSFAFSVYRDAFASLSLLAIAPWLQCTWAK